LARGFNFLGYPFIPAGLSLSVVTRWRHQKKLTSLDRQYNRLLRAYLSGWIERSLIRRTFDRAQAYLNPGPSLILNDDAMHLLEANQKWFTA
jgi:hypothetical protein